MTLLCKLLNSHLLERRDSDHPITLFSRDESCICLDSSSTIWGCTDRPHKLRNLDWIDIASLFVRSYTSPHPFAEYDPFDLPAGQRSELQGAVDKYQQPDCDDQRTAY
jgi:hypothetical protein